jgi:hypothetical protein
MVWFLNVTSLGCEAKLQVGFQMAREDSAFAKGGYVAKIMSRPTAAISLAEYKPEGE